ncbi:MAG TPA: MdtP family multidrug efflux transporter outer membrane subunit [Candidatus Acidoferrales bacterium]|nr:MdtP family multidrug efflux transporter outer membrane subunit [Candidatus Acidoferrales bacterium]
MVKNRRTPTSAPTRLRWLGALLVCGVCGCALMHENSKPIPEIQPQQIRLADDIHLAREGWPSARWWTGYNDPQLDALISQALSDAPTMAIARSRLDQARAQVELVKAGTSLQATAIAAVNRERVSSNGFLSAYAHTNPQLGASGPWYTEGIIGVGASYPFDIWGKQRDQVNAAIGVQNAQLAEEAAVELEISTDVAQLYYGIQTTLHTLDLLQQAHEIVAATVEAHAARASRGWAPDTFTQQARAQQLAIERQVTEAQSLIRQLREALRALVGAHVDNLPNITQVPLPTSQASLPPTLSYELLARRPDLQAMRWYVQASVSQIDAAKAAFYPSFDIKAFFGFNALRMSDLLNHESLIVNIVPGVSLPIFDGGRLNANLKSATAANNTAIAQYNQAVLNAVRDVAVTGTRLQGLDQEERLQSQKISAVTFLQDSAEAHYQRGLANKITALEARLPVISDEIALLGIRGRQLSEEIALVKALGGGYHADQFATTSPR